MWNQRLRNACDGRLGLVQVAGGDQAGEARAQHDLADLADRDVDVVVVDEPHLPVLGHAAARARRRHLARPDVHRRAGLGQPVRLDAADAEALLELGVVPRVVEGAQRVVAVVGRAARPSSGSAGSRRRRSRPSRRSCARRSQNALALKRSRSAQPPPVTSPAHDAAQEREAVEQRQRRVDDVVRSPISPSRITSIALAMPCAFVIGTPFDGPVVPDV